jgi:hypothetical protein
MSTLVIHPSDKSTDFLKPIYTQVKNALVIKGGITKNKLKILMEEAETVIMCGHGSPDGLYAIGQFDDLGYNDFIIDKSFSQLLKDKEMVVAIWCYAQQFIEAQDIQPAYYSDMFISEVAESVYCGLTGVNQSQVDQSNHCFSQSLAPLVHLDPVSIQLEMKNSAYAKLANSNPVAAYNYPKLGCRAPQIANQFSVI